MKIFLLRRIWFTAGACLLAALAILWVVNHPAVAGASAAPRELPIYSVQRDYKVCSLTFDAAWGTRTPAADRNIGEISGKGDVFVVGFWVDKFPESVKALAEAGHEIMNHSDRHEHMTRLTRDQIIRDLNACNDKIEAVTGVRPLLMRPPYGEYDNTLISSAVRSIGMEAIQWDVDSLDWKDLSAEEITKRVVSKVQPGSIVLFHNAALHTPEALPGIIEQLMQEGYKFAPVSELLLKGEYRIDHTGRQHPVLPGRRPERP